MIYLVGFLLFIFVGIPWAILSSKAEQEQVSIKKMKDESLEEKLNQYATYYSGKVLRVKKRGKDLAQGFKMRNKEHVTFAYQPTTYIYTSATVGGITTGGIDKTGGHNSLVRKNTTEKCELLYFEHTIEYIELTDELYKEAKQSKIKRYLDKDKKRIIVVNTNKLNTAATAATIFGVSSATTLNIYSDLDIEASRTREECNEIIDWICGNN